MQVSEVMSTNVELLTPQATLVEAAQKMKKMDVGMLPVCDGDRVQGVLTDRDIVISAVAEGQDVNSASVIDFVQREPKWVYSDSEVEEAARLMATEQIRRLIVVDRNKRLVGVLSLGDISTRSDEVIAGDVLEQVSQPTTQHH